MAARVAILVEKGTGTHKFCDTESADVPTINEKGAISAIHHVDRILSPPADINNKVTGSVYVGRRGIAGRTGEKAAEKTIESHGINFVDTKVVTGLVTLARRHEADHLRVEYPSNSVDSDSLKPAPEKGNGKHTADSPEINC